MNRPPLDKTAAEFIEGIPPFTITIENANDAAFLADAVILKIGGGSIEGARELCDLLKEGMKIHGPHGGFEKFFEISNKAYPGRFPKWLLPLFKHIVTHMQSKYGKPSASK